MSAKKSLVAYYSRKGNNYVGGNIVNLPVGNTEVIAKKIQAFTGADLFEIIPVKEYPLDYTETTEVAQDELRKGLRPQITDTISDMSTYDVLFLGYPNWWGTMPMPVFTFLEGYDFSRQRDGKKRARYSKNLPQRQSTGWISYSWQPGK